MDFAVWEDHSENQIKWKERQIVGPCQRTKKAVKHVSDGDNN